MNIQKFQSEYENLNTEQKFAVDHFEGPMLCLAGPGTGKTQIIAMRIANILLKTQMNPYNILCLTFTESGAVAMRKRLLEIIGPAAYRVKISTFHGFCNEIILENPERFSFKDAYESLIDVERVGLFREILDELPVSGPLTPFYDRYSNWKDISNKIKELKKEDISPEQFANILIESEVFLSEFKDSFESFLSIRSNAIKEEDVLNILAKLKNSQSRTALHFSYLFQSLLNAEGSEKKDLKAKIKKIFEDSLDNLSKQKELAKIYKSYQEKLEKMGRYDYEDMIVKVINLFEKDQNFKARYQELYQYILVDEFQDTNGSQNQIIRLLSDFFESPNLFAVGDDKQSIFRFQGASLENILSFEKNYKDVKVIKLKENYRNQQHILDAAYSLILNNINRLQEEPLNAAKEKDLSKLALFEFATEDSENFFITKKIQELINSGTRASEIAVLYRDNKDALDLMDLLNKTNISYRLEQGENILRDKDVLNLLDLIRFINDMTQSQTLFRILNFNFLKFNALDAAKIAVHAGKNHKTFFDIISDESELKAANVSEPQKFLDFIKSCAVLKANFANKIFQEFFEDLIKEIGYLDFALHSEYKILKLNRLSSFFEEIKFLNRTKHDLSLEDFLTHINILIENDLAIYEKVLPNKGEAIRLMTAHKSKGLEFEHVFITKCFEKHWGDKPDRTKIKLPIELIKTDFINDKKDKNEDERRLFYVAMTRAKKRIYLSYSKLKKDNFKEQNSSIFINEIDQNLIDKKDSSNYENEVEEVLLNFFLEAPEKDENIELENFIKGLLENYKISPTHLNNYLECPKKFYYKNLLRIPAAKEKHMSFGTAIHSALEDFLTDYKNSCTPSKNLLLSSFEKRLNLEILSPKDFKDSLEHGQNILNDYFENYSKDIQTNALLEYSFDRENIFIDEIPVRGKIDKIEFLDDKNNVNVVDYKTGQPTPEKYKKGSDNWRQIIFYKLLCENSQRHHFTVKSGEIDFIERDKKTGNFIKAKISITKEDLDQVKTELKSMYSELQDLSFLNTQGCGECEWCKTQF